MALGLDKDFNKSQTRSILAPWAVDDPTLPSREDIQRVWGGKDVDTEGPPETLLTLDNVEIRRRRDGNPQQQPREDQSDDSILWHPLSLTIQKGHRWLMTGHNKCSGAGNDEKSVDDPADCTHDETLEIHTKHHGTRLAWVSAESHMDQVLQGEDDDERVSAWDTIIHRGKVPDSIVSSVIQLVFDRRENKEAEISFLKDRPLHELSRGQKKVV
eukprot:scaffold1918_cov154-Amphora_coffeaeformis.AAC.2